MTIFLSIYLSLSPISAFSVSPSSYPLPRSLPQTPFTTCFFLRTPASCLFFFSFSFLFFIIPFILPIFQSIHLSGDGTSCKFAQFHVMHIRWRRNRANGIRVLLVHPRFLLCPRQDAIIFSTLSRK